MKPFLLVLAALAFLFAAVTGGLWMGATNREASLRNRFEAKQKANEASFDTMWKIIQQKGQVKDQFRGDFKEIYKDLIAGRATGAGALGKFIAEANPQFDVSLFKSVMNSIEGERRRFFKDQEILLDIKREHDDVRTRFPSRLFVGGVAPLEAVIVTSEKTADAFKTGREELDK